MTGTRNTVDGLWDIPISKYNEDQDVSPPPTGPRKEHKLSVIIRKRKTHTDLARYLHACLFLPVSTTLIKAIDRNALATFPGLTSRLVRKHLPEVEAPIQGHMREESQGLQPTKTRCAPVVWMKGNESDYFPLSDTPNIKKHEVAYNIVKAGSLAYTDITGRFPQKSRRRNQYILVAYHWDANLI